MTSSTPARVKRTSVAGAGKASVSAGRAMCESALCRDSMSQSSSESMIMNPVTGGGGKPSMRPLSGATPSFIAKKSCSSSASQNAAMASPETVITRRTWSSSELRLSADITPSGMPSATDSDDRHQGQLQGGRQARAPGPPISGAGCRC